MGGGRLRAAVVHGGSTECQSIDRAFYEVENMLCLPPLYFNSITVPNIYCNYSKTFQCIFLLVILFFFFLQYLLLPLSST